MGILLLKDNKRGMVELLRQIADGLEKNTIVITGFDYTVKNDYLVKDYFTYNLDLTLMAPKEKE